MNVRRACVAGSFYPENAVELKAMVSGFFRELQGKDSLLEGRQVLGIVSPHAGFVYSGFIAAQSYSYVNLADYDLLIVIGPSHYLRFRTASIFDGDAYETPLGRILIATDVVKQLREINAGVLFIPEAHDREHAIETQLPFLSVIAGEEPVPPILPVVVGTQNFEDLIRLSHDICQVTRGLRTLWVASSDLSHFHREGTARQLDIQTLSTIEKTPAKDFLSASMIDRLDMCGYSALMTMVSALNTHGGYQATATGYANSAAVNGDYTRVVGYGSLVLYD